MGPDGPGSRRSEMPERAPPPLPPGPVRHPTPQPGLAGLVAPIAAISIFGLSISMSYPMLSLLLERMEASGTAIGLSTMAPAIAMVAFAPVLPRVMATTGLPLLMIGAGLAIAVILLAYPLLPEFWVWFALRAAYGFCATSLFFASEYWVVANAGEGRRGRMVAIYSVSLSVSFLLGPLLVGWIGVEGVLPFAIASGIMLAGLIPMFWGMSHAPSADAEHPPAPGDTLRFFVSDPTILLGVSVFAIVEFGTIALLPVWGVRSGLSESEAVIAMASFAGGAILLSGPIGVLADRLDRRRMLVGLAAGTAVAPLAMVAVAPSLPGIYATCLFWGGVAVGLYLLALTELGARYSGAKLAEGNAAVILAYGLGALVSPIALGAAMDAIPPDGLLFASAAVAAGYSAFVAMRVIARPRPTLDSAGRPRH